MAPGSIILLLITMESTLGKYVYIRRSMSWLDAQKHCRDQYTDLATITNQADMEAAQQVMGSVSDSVWIGLQRDSINTQKWIWSGGGEVTSGFWAPSQPDSLKQQYGTIRNSLWYDELGGDLNTFLCSSVLVVRQYRAWEQAIDHCKKQRYELASVTSKAELMLFQRELSKSAITDFVWIGMGFLGGKWMWVNGRPITYEAWDFYGKPLCPEEEMRCVALLTSDLQAANQNGADLQGDTQLLYLREWTTYICEQKLTFICY